MTATGPEVVTMGEAMHLLIAEPGVSLARARRFESGIAGAEANVAVGLARLGRRVRWIGRVGADPSGQMVLSALCAEGIDVTHVEVDPARPTGLLLRSSHPWRAIEVQYARQGSAATALDADRLLLGLKPRPRLVHVTGITAMLSDPARVAVNALLAAARSAGIVVSFDPNIRRRLGPLDRWRESVAPLLAKADLVFAGAGELDLLGVTGGAQSLLDRGVTSVIVKNPDHTCTVRTAEGTWSQPPLAASVIDPVGAGDALVAGYLDAWLHGRSPADALRSGAVCAAYVIAAVSDTEGLPTGAELCRALAAGGSGAEEAQR